MLGLGARHTTVARRKENRSAGRSELHVAIAKLSVDDWNPFIGGAKKKKKKKTYVATLIERAASLNP